MSQNTSRRDFLASSAKVATAAGLLFADNPALAGDDLTPTAGPKPATIGADGKIRIGCIGVGGRCKDLLHHTFPDGNVEIVALADPYEPNIEKTIERIKKAGRPAPDVYKGENDWRDKLLAREDIDAVIIAVPCDLHAQMYVTTFAAGKHMYAEKPMCIAVPETDAIVNAQKKNPDVICQIGFQRRASSFYQETMKRLHDGMCGELFEARGTWRLSGGPLGMPGTGTQIWFGRRKRSGDWMLEQACHTWDVLCWAAQQTPTAASGVGKTGLFKDRDPERDVTDCYMAHLEFGDGFIADFEHNWCCPNHEDMHFKGVFERFCGKKGGIDLGLYPKAASWYPYDPKEKPIQIADTSPSATQQSVEAFYQALRTSSKPAAGVEEGKRATLTGLLVRQAVYENRRVTMQEMLAKA
jgi:predicted dehydrogenase